MRNFNEVASALLTILFVSLCVRVALEAIHPILLPLFAAAVAVLAIWLWVRLRA